ncbi:YihY/virulence factor BrkB family protein [Petrimonas sulfuriphila]|jgi:membrane protein|uniref:YihY/virulence factor BrkB family protein n=1 Tax=Petrimonas sulfuriphila TaxID=285070 RepID=UPI000EBDDE7F|nr:YihY/virulence factor BrkB family protein [Porphyromonadaceae bacterium]
MLKRKKRVSKQEEEDKPGLFERIRLQIKEWVHFLTYEIWRLNPENFSNKKNVLHNVLKVTMLTVRGVQEQNLGASSRSLTYRTILSLVPMLAVLFAIARGFGFEKILESQIFDFFSNSDTEITAALPESKMATDTLIDVSETTSFTIETIIKLVNNSLEHAKGGVFAGIGVILLLYTVILLFSDIENSFNRIWGVKKGRSIQRRAVDYFALILLLPIFAVLNYSLTALIQASTGPFDKFSYILDPVVTQVLNFLPFLVMIITLTLLYRFMPNTKVKWASALIGGIVGGVAIQLFQMIYLNGQLWIAKYNAIYGAFAAIPLLLLWVQMSWFIVLIGAELSYSAQNVRKFSFDRETKNISRRFRDFFTIMIASVIVRRFAEGETPLTADQISMKCKIPIKLTNDIIDELHKLQVILPTPTPDDDRVMAYQPALDINLLTVNDLIEQIDKEGSEDFLIDVEGDFARHWNALMHTRMSVYESPSDIMLKDL